MNLNFKVLGKGDAIIILHGLLGSSDNWLTVAKSFSENYTVYLIDQRNHGRSPWSEEWNYDVMSADLLEFIEQNNILNPTIIGHSMGGKTVMNFATRYKPELFSKLIVVDIAPKLYSIDYGEYLKGMQSMDIINTQNRTQAEEHLTPFAPEYGVRQFLLKNLYRNEDGKFAWRPNLKVISRDLKNIGVPLSDDAVTNKPTLFIRGENSDYILDSDLENILKHFPNAKLETIKNASHWVQADQPIAFIKTVISFLNQS